MSQYQEQARNLGFRGMLEGICVLAHLLVVVPLILELGRSVDGSADSARVLLGHVEHIVLLLTSRLPVLPGVRPPSHACIRKQGTKRKVLENPPGFVNMRENHEGGGSRVLEL